MTAVWVVLFSSCSKGPKPIEYGKDDCSFCKMTVMDKRFAVEIISRKGKVFIMDDLICARQFITSGGLEVGEVESVYVSNFNGQNDLLLLKNSFLVKSPSINGPMQGHEGVFATENEANDFIQKNEGILLPSSSFPGIR